jgi:hypothetical protein
MVFIWNSPVVKEDLMGQVKLHKKNLRRKWQSDNDGAKVFLLFMNRYSEGGFQGKNGVVVEA